MAFSPGSDGIQRPSEIENLGLTRISRATPLLFLRLRHHDPGQHTTDQGGEPAALPGGLELGHRLMPWREARRKELLVPAARDHPPAVAPELVGKVLDIADARNLEGVAEMGGVHGRDRGSGDIR